MSQTYHPGQRIRCRGEEWQVTRADLVKVANGPTVWMVQARGLTNIVMGMEFCFMSDLDEIEAVDPADIEPVIDTARGRKAKLYWEANLRRLLPRNGALYLGQHGACDPYPYQLDPAAKALHLMRPRILIGDAVGLGKTIECGILLSELIRRGKAKRVLCAVPKAVLEQFQNEMWGRFAIPFHRLDTKGLERLRQDLPSTMNPFFHFDKTIISIDTLKLKKYQMLLEKCSWDVLIVDECHNVADRTSGSGGSLRHRTVRRLADKANAVILMSATPHDGTKQGFASLIKLLDRTKIHDDENYKREDFEQHFIRRTRTKVADQIGLQGKRRQNIQEIPLTLPEAKILELLHLGEKSTALLTKRHPGARELFKTTLIKSFLSSPKALAETVKKKLDQLSKADKGPTKDTENFLNFLRDVEAATHKLKGFSRLDALRTYLKANPTGVDDRLVIFTERLATMNLITEFLTQEGFADGMFDPKSETQTGNSLVAQADGSMGDIDLNKIVRNFQSKKHPIHILVATNVASEGLNLHDNCHRLIHFDLPWSLITLEQRNGRIDRLGQKKTPEIYYFASKIPDGISKDLAEDVKDDLWIVNKIKDRSKVAAEDMDEEESARFVDAAQEEAENTLAWEEKRLQNNDPSSLEDLLNGPSTPVQPDEKPHRKFLPTLYEKSPAEFIVGVCKEAKIATKAVSGTSVSIELTKNLRFESQQWPREYRPDLEDDTLVLEGDTLAMQTHYKTKQNLDAHLDKTFMNEIHPAIAMLENTAFGFFPGKQVPTVTLKGDDTDTVYFLIQSTLFNECNDVVMQYWQVIQHKKGSPKLHALFPMQDNDHALQVAQWLNQTCKSIKAKDDLSDNERKRITGLTKKVIEMMQELTHECREQRGRALAGELKNELNRIKGWESTRRNYLETLISRLESEKHGGTFSLINRARMEKDSMDKDSRNFKSFVESYLKTNPDADIRILGCFIVGE